jgi:heme exporter protein B
MFTLQGSVPLRARREMRASIAPCMAATSTTFSACTALLRRDLMLAWRRRGDAFNPVLFALMVTALFPLALGPEAERLRPVAAGVILVAALLASLLALDALFRGDYEDGSLEQLVLSPHPLPLLLGCKIAVHWLTTALPLIAAAPLLGEWLFLPRPVLPVLLAALALLTPLLSLVGAVCVALTVGMRRSGMLLALLVLPLYAPLLIFAAGACAAAQAGLPNPAPLLWLGAVLALAFVCAPLACAAALRISLS